MLLKDPEQKLLDILSLALRGDDVDLRDAVVSYLAMTELPGGAEVIKKYVKTESMDWLKDYAKKVLEHLEEREAGKPSKPPKRLTWSAEQMHMEGEILDVVDVKSTKKR